MYLQFKAIKSGKAYMAKKAIREQGYQDKMAIRAIKNKSSLYSLFAVCSPLSFLP